ILISPLTIITTLFPYTTLFRSGRNYLRDFDLYSCRFKLMHVSCSWYFPPRLSSKEIDFLEVNPLKYCPRCNFTFADFHHVCDFRSEEHTSELQSRGHLVCRLLL